MEWFYASGSDRVGPVDDAALARAVQSGAVTNQTLVWAEGMAEWVAYGGCSEAMEVVGKIAGGNDTVTAAPNPYAAPAAELKSYSSESYDVELASRGSRLLATILDGMLGLVLIIPLIIAGIVGAANPEAEPSAVVFIFVLLGALGIFILQIYLIVKYSATFGKKMLGLYIADLDGEPATPGKIIGMRMFVNGLICNIPFIGAFYSLADILCIFRDDRRCLHDMLAGTQVLKRDG